MCEEKELFQSRSICWICENLIDNDDEKMIMITQVKNLEVQLIGVVT